MKRFSLLLAVLAFAIVVPAQAKNLVKPPHPTHPTHPSSGKGHSCTVRNEGYNASGTLMSATLTAATAKDHFNGTITVDVTRANHKAATGTQPFTLTNARVRFGKGVDMTAPAAGSAVRLHGKITVLPHGCPTTAPTSTAPTSTAPTSTTPTSTAPGTVTVRNLEIKQAKPAK